MKISIDSAEPLEDVMRVIGAVYGVTLTVAISNAASHTDPDPTTTNGDGRPAAMGKASTSSSGRSRSKRRLARVSTAELRSWAQQNGHTVSDRGPIPAAVKTAYHQAQRG